MKHKMVCTSQDEYDNSTSHCHICGFVHTGDDAIHNIPLEDNCPGKAADAARDEAK